MCRSVIAAAVLAGAIHAGVPVRAGEAEGFVAVPIASRHIGTRHDYEEFNPGIGFGVHLTEPDAGRRVTFEAGAYRNSHGEMSQFALASADWPLTAGASVRAGVAAGLARYPGRGKGFRGLGLPAFGDWVPLAGATMTFSAPAGREVWVGAFPAPGVADLILTFQLRHPF